MYVCVREGERDEVSLVRGRVCVYVCVREGEREEVS